MIVDETLAVKVLKPIGTYEKVADDAYNEFIKLLHLRNPFIIYVYDAFEFRDTFYIVTELCHSPLTNLFKMENFDGLIWLMPIARSLLQAIHFLHTNNYVHQDIHPGNVLLTFIKDELIPDGPEEVLQFRLGDLGITKLLDEMDAQDTLAQWMLPPEVLNTSEYGPIDHRLDIYHIGLLFLQLVLNCVS